ncbi:MAG: alpha/beta hydrolase [Actinomycetota bacterium]|nr:alpha/beta hydrolase [Actinomycetota bacterium]
MSASDLSAPAPRLRFFDVTSSDGTRLRAWTNDAQGPTVLLCNGLGTNPYAWPALTDPSCGVRVLSWNHRGIGGSARPADPSHVRIEEFVQDALAVIDHEGVDACVVMGWSMGVNIAFELAVGHPARVTGLFAVAGVPGNTFGAMLEPLPIPRMLRRRLTEGTARVMHRAGSLLTPVISRVPWTDLTAGALRHSGFMLPGAPSTVVKPAVSEFLTTPVDWYMHLALHTSQHERVTLSTVRVPTTFVAGRWDVLAGTGDLRSAADDIPGARYVELRGSHFLPMEQPRAVHAELLALLHRVSA